MKKEAAKKPLDFASVVRMQLKYSPEKRDKTRKKTVILLSQQPQINA